MQEDERLELALDVAWTNDLREGGRRESSSEFTVSLLTTLDTSLVAMLESFVVSSTHCSMAFHCTVLPAC